MLRSSRSILALFAFSAFAQEPLHLEMEELPAEVRGFVEEGTMALALEKADLNRDGREDFVLVLEKQKVKAEDPDIEDGQRPLILLVRRSDGTLEAVKRNEKVVYCSSCGGMMGDPFMGVEVGPGKFTVQHYGGSAWRWSADYQFNYSRRDNTWQLVKVTQTSFHAMDPDNKDRKVFKPPRDFGKIDIADFDPDTWDQ